jgi:membrane protease YdiL (CAAX protease family)
MSNKTSVSVLIRYLVVLMTCSTVFYLLNNNAHGYGLYVFALMWCPALAYYVVPATRTFDIGWTLPSGRYLMTAFILPLFYVSVSYLAIALSKFSLLNHETLQTLKGKLGFPDSSDAVAINIYITLQSIVGMLGYCANTLGEEIGWRGFLVPYFIRKHSYTVTSVAVGMIWAAWHLPLFGWSAFTTLGGARELLLFFIGILSLSFILTKLRIVSGSIWPCVILHAAHNNFIQRVYTPLLKPTVLPDYYSDETGIFIPTLLLISAVMYTYRFRTEGFQKVK